MSKYIAKLSQIIILFFLLNSANADQNSSAMLKGKYAFTGVYNCLNAVNGGFNAIIQPVNPQYSSLAYITVNGFINFDGKGKSSQNGNFVETVSPASASNTSAIPGVASGTFTVEPSPYSVTNKGKITVSLGSTNVVGLTGPDTGVTLIITPGNSELSGTVSKNGSIVLTTAVPLIQTLTVFVNGNEIVAFPRACSVTMTLIP